MILMGGLKPTEPPRYKREVETTLIEICDFEGWIESNQDVMPVASQW